MKSSFLKRGAHLYRMATTEAAASIFSPTDDAQALELFTTRFADYDFEVQTCTNHQIVAEHKEDESLCFFSMHFKIAGTKSRQIYDQI